MRNARGKRPAPKKTNVNVSNERNSPTGSAAQGTAITRPNRTRSAKAPAGIAKCPTGIRGLDDITQGGLPRGRPTLVCGGAGSGKTLLGMEFIVRGIREFGEPGVFMAFEETAEELSQNVASLGFDVEALIRSGEDGRRLRPRRAQRDRGDRRIRPGGALRPPGQHDRRGRRQAGRPRLAGGALRGPPQRGDPARRAPPPLPLAQGARASPPSSPASRATNTLTRHGLEEYVSDCVIFLDHRVANQVATRRLRIVKYRGSAHGTNEYPTLIDEHGLSVLPISSLGLDYPVVKERVSTGIARLDAMLGGKGYYQGQQRPGQRARPAPARRSIAAAFADGVCAPGRAVPLLLLRGVPRPDHPQHGLDRHRPGPVGVKGAPEVPLGALDPLRPGAAPGHHPQARERVRARGRRHGPDHEPDLHRRDRGDQVHADPGDRLPEGPA